MLLGTNPSLASKLVDWVSATFLLIRVQLKCSSGFCVINNWHIINAVSQVSNQAATSDVVTLLLANLASQRVLSGKLVSHMFHSLLGASSIANIVLLSNQSISAITITGNTA